MNGSTLTLSLVGALALGAAAGRRGSRSARWVYHLTYRSDLPSIARQGLTPRSDTQDAWDNEPGVYFVNTFGYEAGAPESEEPAWFRLPAPHALPASFWTNLQEGHTLISFPPDAIEVWVDAEGRPAAKADGVAWKPLREVVHVKRGSRATDPTSTPAFRRWFGESKVVDGAGRPLVVYHGTGKAFDAFDPAKRGSELRDGGPFDARSKLAFWFTSDRETARSYAEAAETLADGRVVEAWVRMTNPLVVKAPAHGDGGYIPDRADAILRRAIRSGHDGVIFRDVYDGLGDSPRSDVYAVFTPEQIKSATGNRGTFDPADPRISYNRSPR